MYFYANDSMCHNNLLDYFCVVGNKIKPIMKLKYTQIQYRTYMGCGAIDEIEKMFYVLKKLL